MIPITRKELYLNKIVGNNNYETPEKPITTEEFFFAEILGEAVQAPEPLTRYQKYLAKSDNRAWRYSQSQFFIALSAGTYTLQLSGVGANSRYSDIYVFKSNNDVIYSENISGKTNIVITFTLNTPETIGIEIKLYDGKYRFMLVEGSTPLPYEPYGESVGDRTGNLFDMSSAYAIGYIDDSGNIAIAQGYMITTYDFIPIDQNSSYSIKICGKLNDNTNQRKIRVAFYDRDQIFISRTGLGEASDVRTFNAINNSHYIRLSIDDGNTNIMLNEGSTALPYEPYGYKVPVTVSNGTDTLTTPIYLPEQIRKVGDEAEYIDYAEQKFVKKFYELTLNFDDMNNNETYPGWSGGTALVEYCNKIRSLATNPNSYIPIQYSSISNFTAIFNVSSNNSILYLGNSSVIGHTQSKLKEIYAGQSITFILKMPDTDLDVTLPALPTLTGTNVLTVGTAIQPSSVYIKGQKERE